MLQGQEFLSIVSNFDKSQIISLRKRGNFTIVRVARSQINVKSKNSKKAKDFLIEFSRTR